MTIRTTKWQPLPHFDGAHFRTRDCRQCDDGLVGVRVPGDQPEIATCDCVRAAHEIPPEAVRPTRYRNRLITVASTVPGSLVDLAAAAISLAHGLWPLAILALVVTVARTTRALRRYRFATARDFIDSAIAGDLGDDYRSAASDVTYFAADDEVTRVPGPYDAHLATAIHDRVVDLSADAADAADAHADQ